MMKLALAFACVVAAVAASNVVVLTPDNFDSVVDGSKNVFVDFYAPWCGHCKNLEPEYEIVGDAFASTKDVVIAKVDADAHKELGSRFGVTGFPTLKFFGKSTTAAPYEGGRTADDIISFVNDKAGSRARVKKAPSAVTILDDSNFESIALDPTKDVLVEFYAPWCGHCKKLAPDYEKVAAAYAGEKDVVIASFDADKFKETPPKYGVTGFPTLKWFGKNNKETPLAYESGRDVPSFISYVNEKAGVSRDIQGRLGELAGRLPTFDSIAKRFVAAGADFKALITEAEDALKTHTESDAKHGSVYHKIFNAIEKRGVNFVTTELARLERLLSGAVNPAKIDEFTIRRNILKAFSSTGTENGDTAATA